MSLVLTFIAYTRKFLAAMESDIIESLRAENAALKQQLSEQLNQIGVLEQQNGVLVQQNNVLVQQNNEIMKKLDTVLANQLNKNTTVQHNLQLNIKKKRFAESDSDYGLNKNNGKNQKSDVADLAAANNKVIPMDDDVNSGTSESSNSSQQTKSSNVSMEDIGNTSWTDAVAESDLNDNIKPSPIQLKNYDAVAAGEIYKNIRSCIDGGFKWRQLNAKSPARIYCENIQVKNNIMKALSEMNVEFNTYAQANEKKHAFIVRGMSHGDTKTNINHITMAFLEHGITTPITVSVFETAKMKREGITAAGLYKVVLDSGSDLSFIANIREIANFQVKIEKMKKSETIKCRNCQRFNHTANQCHFKYRCVQCVFVQQPGKCPRKINTNLPIGCVNCGEHKLTFAGHTANNFRDCGYFKSISGG